MDEAVKLLPEVEWWIKSDGCDVVSGLTESMKLEWNGDVDLGDGSVQKQHDDYVKHINLVNCIDRQLCDMKKREATIQDLHSLKQSLQSDLSFIPSGIYA